MNSWRGEWHIRDLWNSKPMPPAQGRYWTCLCLMGTAVRRSTCPIRDPNDPMYGYEPADRTSIWGWIAGAAGLVIILVLGLALGMGHGPTRVASNNVTHPQTTAPGTPSTMPGLTPPPSQAPNR